MTRLNYSNGRGARLTPSHGLYEQGEAKSIKKIKKELKEERDFGEARGPKVEEVEKSTQECARRKNKKKSERVKNAASGRCGQKIKTWSENHKKS